MDEVVRHLFASSEGVPGFEAVVAPDLMYSTIGAPVPELNAISGARLTSDGVERRIDEALEWFATRGQPPGWLVGPADTPADLADRLERRGLRRRGPESPGMATPLDQPLEHVGTARVSVTRIQNNEEYRAWCRVMADGFGEPELERYMWPFAQLGLGDDNPARSFLAWLDGQPVATSQGIVAGRFLGIFNVTTLPDVRRRGIGRAVTLAALQDGREHGCDIALLQSSPEGHRVYERLGFRTFGTYQLWAFPAEAT